MEAPQEISSPSPSKASTHKKDTVSTRFSTSSTFTGFDYLRIGLSVAICIWHSWWIFTGHLAWELELWRGWLSFIPKSFVPLFFALSGFLVAGSLERNKLRHFLALRALRIIPALAFEVVVSACIIGTIFTKNPIADYLVSGEFAKYFLNVIGVINVTLPGVFASNPLPELMNPQLWTIPFELECYIAISVLSVLGLVWNGNWLLRVSVLLTILGTGYSILFKQSRPPLETIEGHMPGKLLVLMFLAGIVIYRHKSTLPYNNLLGLGSLLILVLVFNSPWLYYLSPLPAAYFVAWIGLKKLPPIPFGDLSYGVFLFHFPATQLVMHFCVGSTVPWWQFASLSLAASALCASASWKLIEKPLLGKKKLILGRMDKILQGIKLIDFRKS